METLDGSHSTQRGESMRREEAGQCFANETAISNENKRCQSRAESSGLSGFPGDRGSLITVWLEVRVLPGPPRTPPFEEISWRLAHSPRLAGFVTPFRSPKRRSNHNSVFSRALSPDAKSRFLGNRDRAEQRLVRSSAYGELKPRMWCWRDHSAGSSQSLATPMPCGRRPSMAARTRSGARKESEIVMLTLRALQPSRAAIASTFASGLIASSSSQRRPRAIEATRSARFSERIGRTW